MAVVPQHQVRVGSPDQSSIRVVFHGVHGGLATQSSGRPSLRRP